MINGYRELAEFDSWGFGCKMDPCECKTPCDPLLKPLKQLLTDFVSEHRDLLGVVDGAKVNKEWLQDKGHLPKLMRYYQFILQMQEVSRIAASIGERLYLLQLILALSPVVLRETLCV